MGVDLLINMESGKVPFSDFAKDTMVAQANIKIRMAFLRKVYGILSFQILLTILVTSAAMFSPIIRFFINENQWLVGVSFLVALGLLFGLMVKGREFPTNYILLALFTPVEAFSIAVVTTYYDQMVVLQAFLLTLTVTIGLTLYTFQSRKDFSSWKSGLFTGLWILIITGFIGNAWTVVIKECWQMFLGSSGLELLMATGGSVLFSFFIIYDTQRLMTEVSPEDYILATIELYLDILNLFLHLLRLLEAARRK